MKTPIQELIKLESDLTQMFDSDERVAMALLEHIRTNRKEMLDKERDHCNYFAFQFRHEKFTLKDIKKEYDATFNTKER